MQAKPLVLSLTRELGSSFGYKAGNISDPDRLAKDIDPDPDPQPWNKWSCKL
jgi:hypothetical protein